MPDPSFVPVPFGEWRPDRAPHMSPDLAEAENVLPMAGAYMPFPDHVPITGSTLPSAAKGFFMTVLPSGMPEIYSATASTIYRIGSGSVTSVYASSANASRWWFAQVGGKVCAGTDGIAPVGGQLGGAFSLLGGTPPQAAVGSVVARDYLVLGNLKNEPVDGTCPNRVRWSGMLNPDTWGTSIATGADFNDMEDEGGDVIQITGRSVGLVFQRRAITRMQFTGNASTVFAFTTLELGRGAVAAGAVVDAGPLVFFRADDGFFVHDGTQAIPIGTGKVDDWFANNADPSKVQLMRSGYDPVNRCVLWAFAENGQATNNAILCYSISDQRFTLARKAVQEIGYSAVIGASPTLPVLGGINSANTYGTFTGANLASKVVTGDLQASPGKRMFVSGIRPLIDATGVQTQVGVRNQATSGAVDWKAATGIGIDGVCPHRADGRYQRFRQTTVAGEEWTRTSGLEVELAEAGER